MKRSIFSLLALASASQAMVMAASDTAQILLPKEQPGAQSKTEISTLLLKRALGETKTISKSKVKWDPKSEKAKLVAIRKVEKVKCCIAFYPDVTILTYLNGSHRMRQVIFKKFHSPSPERVASSSKYSRKHGRLIHQYKWGTIVTHKTQQKIKKNKKAL